MELKDVEEKFRKSMVQNAQLDNEKSAVTYMVELYKDKYTDIEEDLIHIKVFNIFCLLLFFKFHKNIYILMYSVNTRIHVEKMKN